MVTIDVNSTTLFLLLASHSSIYDVRIQGSRYMCVCLCACVHVKLFCKLNTSIIILRT